LLIDIEIASGAFDSNDYVLNPKLFLQNKPLNILKAKDYQAHFA